jgi:alkanesulfonate monooxygenase SsuD/methylene tetrahydromethanopterin reductase-like flavin-dependent oxidoreductase (luciferase family)
MTESTLPSVSLVAVPGRLHRTLELAREIERRGFPGIYSPSLGDALAFCQALAHVTERVRLGTSIVNIYTRHASEYAWSSAFLHELSGGRFHLGIGVSHDPINTRLGVNTGKPIDDMRRFVEQLRGSAGRLELSPIVLAAMRGRMVALAGEIADGLVFANAARSYLPHSLSLLPAEKANDPDFFVGDMIPTCISDDVEAAAARNRKTMIPYLRLPNYRNYWKAAGYVEEMEAIEKAVAANETERIPELVSDRWLADVTLYGTVSQVREGVEEWRNAGLRTPILVPSSAGGGQMKAFEEFFAAFS